MLMLMMKTKMMSLVLLTKMKMMLLASGEIEIMEAISSDRMPWASSQPCNGWHAHGDDDQNGDGGDDDYDIDNCEIDDGGIHDREKVGIGVRMVRKWRQTKSSWLLRVLSLKKYSRRENTLILKRFR